MLDKAVRYPWDSSKELFPGRTKKKASEPEGPEAVIPVISLVALLCGDAETVSGGTRQHQNASSEASSCYSHSTENSSVVVVRCVSICTLMFCRLRDIQSVCTHSVLASKITPDVPKRKLCQRLDLGF